MRHLVLAFPFALACSGAADPEVCASGEYWTGGDEESPLMHPGTDCIDCHARGEGPTYTAAGTVYSDYQQEDDCNGEPGVTVEITDANGDVFTADSNSAGNFFFSPGDTVIAPPYSVRLLVDGVEVNAMVSEQTDPNCASCHTAEGANSAPGRVRIP